MRTSLGLALLGVIAFAPPARAQVRSDPGVRLDDGRVVGKIYVTLSDVSQPYFPVARQALVLHGDEGDSIVVTTSDGGVATFAAAPGAYRLVSSAAVAWHGRSYRWSVPIVVRAGIGPIDLTTQNATTEGVVAEPGLASSGSAASGSPPMPIPPESFGGSRGRFAVVKDGSTATLFSFLFPGAGHYYAHDAGLGTLLLGSYIGGVVLIVTSDDGLCTVDSYSYDVSCSKRDTRIAVGAGLVVASWLTGLIDAHNAAHRYNRAHGLEPARVGIRPYLDRHAAGLGLSVATGR